MIKNIKTGIRYDAKRDDFEQNYGWVDVKLGTVSAVSTDSRCYYQSTARALITEVIVINRSS